MTRRVLLLTLGADPLPSTTPVVAIAASWVPAVYVPPPVPVPGAFAAVAIADGVLLSWAAVAVTSVHVVERAPDVAGAPGAWTEIGRTADLRYTATVANGTKYWWRVRAVVFSRASAYTAAITATAITPIKPGDSLDLIGDGVTYARPLGARLNAGKPWIDFSETINLNRTADNIAEGATRKWAGESGADVTSGKSLDVLADGATYGRPLKSRLAAGRPWVNLGEVENTGRTADNITEGATRKWAGESGADVTSGKSLDVLVDGATYGRPRNSTLLGGVPRGIAFGANLVANPTFAKNLSGIAANVSIATGGVICDDWTVTVSGVHSASLETGGAARQLLLRLNSATTIPANSGYLETSATGASVLDVKPARKYRLYARGSFLQNAVHPAGLLLAHRVRINWMRADGTYFAEIIKEINIPTDPILWDTEISPPAGAVQASVICQCYANNTTAAAMSPAGALWADMRWFEVSLSLINNLDTEVEHGATYGKVANTDLLDSAGVRRVGLRVAGSGHQPGDQRNALPTTIGSIRARWDGLTISYTVPSTGDPATVTISASAATLRMGSASIAYSAASVNVSQARSTTVTWQLYYLDPTYAGGARTLNATTDANLLANRDDVVWVGNVAVTVPAAGTGGSGAGEPGACVDLMMWLDTDLLARDAQVGDRIDCAVYAEPAGIERRPIMAMPVSVQPCHRIVSASGAAVVASDSTPMTLRDGRTVYMPDMLGEDVLVHDADGLRWEPCVACDAVGHRPVAKINVSDTCYFAGETPCARIATHNATSKP